MGRGSIDCISCGSDWYGDEKGQDFSDKKNFKCAFCKDEDRRMEEREKSEAFICQICNMYFFKEKQEVLNVYKKHLICDSCASQRKFEERFGPRSVEVLPENMPPIAPRVQRGTKAKLLLVDEMPEEVTDG